MKKIIGKIRNPKVSRAIIGVIIVILIVGSYFYFEKTYARVKIDNSLITTPIISIAPSAVGVMTELDAVEGHLVKAGDTLAVAGGQTIRAQSDGLIISADDKVGGTVGPTAPIIQMIRPQNMRVAGTIDENKGLDQIKIGQVVSFTVDALPGKTFWGYVDEVSPSANQTQIAFSISSERPTQQYTVFARFDTSHYPQIKNGMSAKMTVFTK